MIHLFFGYGVPEVHQAEFETAAVRFRQVISKEPWVIDIRVGRNSTPVHRARADITHLMLATVTDEDALALYLAHDALIPLKEVVIRCCKVAEPYQLGPEYLTAPPVTAS
jgi:hypothetical protein